jgi:mono/diheme cytochrome c family protein
MKSSSSSEGHAKNHDVRSPPGGGFLYGVLATVILGVCAAGLVIFTGMLNVGADVPDTGFTKLLFMIARNRSIETRLDNIVAPDLSDQTLIAHGAKLYADNCEKCHLGPGTKDTNLVSGLNPMPPNFGHQNYFDSVKQFWVIKHGIKATAMPNWGRSFDDSTIWSLVAFVDQIPKLDENQFQKLTASHSSPPSN